VFWHGLACRCIRPVESQGPLSRRGGCPRRHTRRGGEAQRPVSARPLAKSSADKQVLLERSSRHVRESAIRSAESSRRVGAGGSNCNRRAGDTLSTPLGLSPPAHRGADSSGRVALIAWFDMTYLGRTHRGRGRVIAADFAQGGRAGRDRGPRIGPGGRGPPAWIEAKGGGWVIWGRAVATTRSLGTLARSVLKERRHRPQGRASDRTGPARGASAGASSA
jgi:hypothetical protein